MNLKNQPPAFVPRQYQAEIEKLSKAALMDMVWDYAQQIAGVGGAHGDTPEGAAEVIEEFRKRREIVQIYREQAKAA